MRLPVYANKINLKIRNLESKLNPLTTARCVAENMMLVVIHEGFGYLMSLWRKRCGQSEEQSACVTVQWVI